jgi:hypothetical protein
MTPRASVGAAVYSVCQRRFECPFLPRDTIFLDSAWLADYFADGYHDLANRPI